MRNHPLTHLAVTTFEVIAGIGIVKVAVNLLAPNSGFAKLMNFI